MTRFVRKLAVLAKIETVYGTDAAPTGSANAILMTEVALTPMAGSEESRDLLLPYMGHQGVVLTGEHVILEGSVEIAGSGTAGDAPAYGPLLRACGLSEVIDAGVSVTYAPVSAGFEALSIYYNLDGVKHVLLGARGSITFEMTPQRIPRYRFRFLGLSGTITDQALPTVDHSAFQTPVVVNKANTTVLLHGSAAPIERLSFDLGNQVEPRLLIGYEGIEITDRRAAGSVTVQAGTLAEKDWFAIAKARTRGIIAVAHGITAGNIVETNGPTVEVGRPTQGASQGIANYTLGLMLVPGAGNDELSIVVK
jgi:hypothetical protein